MPPRPEVPQGNTVVHGENLQVLPLLPDAFFQVIYIDPPFNTGKRRRRSTVTTTWDEDGDRTGFRGRRYSTVELSRMTFPDRYDDYTGFLTPRLEHAHRLLTDSGILYVHLDWREAHYIKVRLDEIFGRDCFLNEIIWAYDYGGRARDRWPAKHDTILSYAKRPRGHYFNQQAITRIPYLAPRLVGPEKVARGKLPTDVWWHTIVPTVGAEKTGYPTQKPEGVVRRLFEPCLRPGDWLLDFFVGSGTAAVVGAAMGARFVVVDDNPTAIEVTRARLDRHEIRYRCVGGPDGTGLAAGQPTQAP